MGRGGVIFGCIHYANQCFVSMSGEWIYIFIEAFANPLIRFRLESYGIGIEMIFLFLLFLVSLFTAIYMAARKILGVTEKETIILYILIFLFVFLNTNVYSEVYYWFVGSSYMMAMTLGLFTIALTIVFFYDNKKGKRGILLSVFGVLACNCFEQSILPGMVYMILWCGFSIKEHKPLWKKSIPFWFMFLSGVIAVAAPGNYARYLSYTTEVNLVKAVIDTAKISLDVLGQVVRQPFVIAMFVFGIYIGIRHTAKAVKGIYPVLAAVLSLAALVINSFPIALGYAGVSFFPVRLYFLLDFVLLTGMIATAICIGMYVKGIPQFEAFSNAGNIEIFMTGFVFLLLYSTLVYGQDIRRLPWVQTVAAMDDVKEIHDAWQDCLITIRDSEEENVVIEMEERYYDSPILLIPRITDDKENWKNRLVAKLWEKESVAVILKENE